MSPDGPDVVRRPTSDVTHCTPDGVGLYLHIPFCHARCGYCDFTTFTGQDHQIDRYVDALIREFSLYRHPTSLRPHIPTVFFGGGTPSLLEPKQVRRILDAIGGVFELSADAEVTMEANPESLTREKAGGWRTAGVNRLSIGLQAFDDALLRRMDRLHTVEDFLCAYAQARQAGFDNLSVDLIYGFPGQSPMDWERTVDATLDLHPDHVSLYALAVEEHTPFHARGLTVDPDVQAGMYEWARQALAARGYDQYEISNFARPGMACRHNLIYWRQGDYLGFGVGAVGCVGGRRWKNINTLSGYFNAIDSRSLPVQSEEHLEAKTMQFERLMLGLRLREGLLWEGFWDAEWKAHRAALQSRRLLEEIAPGRWRIPDHAVALTNQVLLPFAPDSL